VELARGLGRTLLLHVRRERQPGGFAASSGSPAKSTLTIESDIPGGEFSARHGQKNRLDFFAQVEPERVCQRRGNRRSLPAVACFRQHDARR
jgi:hypothetical protein